jgi:hypothetical protein
LPLVRFEPAFKGLGELGVTAKRDADIPVCINPAGRNARDTESDVAIAARWGYSGLAGAVMPGPGKTAAGTRGPGFLDVHLNATTHWKDVPEPVWNCTLGG